MKKVLFGKVAGWLGETPRDVRDRSVVAEEMAIASGILTFDRFRDGGCLCGGDERRRSGARSQL